MHRITFVPRRVRACCAPFSVVLLAMMVFAGAAHATAAKVGPPKSIDALGDSITRGYDSQGSGCGSFADCPANSWATGTNSGVNSYYTRVKALNPAVVLAQPVKSSTTGGNDAVTGAKMGDLPSQATNSVNAPNKPDQVLMLLGANDVCTSSEASMTSVSSFRASLTTGLNTLSSGLPDARIDISSIPNIYNLWKVLRTNLAAQLTWGLAKICQSMLANPSSTSAADENRRLKVQKRNVEFNAVLAEVCALYIHCHYDGGAAYALAFASSDVSTLDYFHPNTNGQAKAAATAFSAGPNFTDLTAPNTTIKRDRPAEGVDDWYENSVTVTVEATDGNDAVAGSEYYYKLDGAADSPWTKYTAPISVTAEGQTTITARSVDSNGNISESKSDVIKIDKTKPAFTLTCPSGPVLLNSEAAYTISGASDDRSGFASDPNGTFPISTSVAGSFANTVQIEDKAGNTTTHQCDIEVVYPTPGIPALSSGVTPNTGAFSLAWTASADPLLYSSLQYTLQHRNAADADWSDVEGAIATPSFSFSAGVPEGEGTWLYRVMAHEGALATAFSAASEPIKVDQSAPTAPTLTPDRSPDYAGGGGWYGESVTLTAAEAGDPLLADGSAGSGVDPASIPEPVTHNTSGSFTDIASVKDLAGNESSQTSSTVQVDATAPSLSVSCPGTVLLNGSASATVSASDGHSGLAADPGGTVAIDTSTAGPKTVTRTATDNVGYETTRSCTTNVLYGYSGLLQPVNSDGTSIFKLGSTVPVKFALTNAAGATVGSAVANLTVAKVTNAIDGSYVEAVSTAAATTGTLFRYDATGKQYIFNLSTNGLSKGTWNLKVTLDGGSSYTTIISLK
jgi:lysophospholipase L1-like esterase